MNKANLQNLAARNSTAEFLIFSQQAGEDSVEVRYRDESIWLTQKMMAELFNTSTDNVSLHLKNIYKEGELMEGATTEESSVVQKEGARKVSRRKKFYNLDAIISVGYRVNSKRATQFRQWTTSILKQFAVQGYVLDQQRMENGSFLGVDYFERLLEDIREIRLSERHFYQQITDIYITSVDYNKDAPTTRDFFAKVHNKLHYAIHGHTAAEVVKQRTDSAKPNMGLSAWANGPKGKIRTSDVPVAKNYLSADELASLGRIVNAYLDLAESRAERRIPMTMEDWATNLDGFLEFYGHGVLQDADSIIADIVNSCALSEFEKYRVIQDRLFESDFDKHVKIFEEKLTEHGGGNR